MSTVAQTTNRFFSAIMSLSMIFLFTGCGDDYARYYRQGTQEKNWTNPLDSLVGQHCGPCGSGIYSLEDDQLICTNDAVEQIDPDPTPPKCGPCGHWQAVCTDDGIFCEAPDISDGFACQEITDPAGKTYDLAVMKYEVTRGLVSDILGPRHISAANGNIYDAPNHAAGLLHIHDSMQIANTLSTVHGLTACYEISGVEPSDPDQYGRFHNLCLSGTCTISYIEGCTGFRLPNVNEFESYSTANQMVAGEDLVQLGWASLNKEPLYPSEALAAPVGSKPPNKHGLYDVTGNVAEQVYDSEQNIVTAMGCGYFEDWTKSPTNCHHPDGYNYEDRAHAAVGVRLVVPFESLIPRSEWNSLKGELRPIVRE